MEEGRPTYERGDRIECSVEIRGAILDILYSC